MPSIVKREVAELDVAPKSQGRWMNKLTSPHFKQLSVKRSMGSGWAPAMNAFVSRYWRAASSTTALKSAPIEQRTQREAYFEFPPGNQWCESAHQSWLVAH